MKLRAPCCRESTFWISVPACSSGISSSWAMAPAGSNTTAIISKCLIMSRYPLRHWLHAVALRIPGHQQKESEIQEGAAPGEHRINSGGRLQAANRQRDERRGENSQHNLVQRTAIADGAHRRAVQPGQEEQHDDGGPH